MIPSGSGHRHRALRLWVLAVTLIGAVAFAVRQAGAQLSLEAVADRVKGVNPTLQTFVVEQTFDVRFLLMFHWRIRTTLYAARPAAYRIVVHDPPVWLARLGTAFSAASSPETMLHDYRATAIRDIGEGRLSLDLVAMRPGVNPPAGSVIVDTERWLIEELRGRYEWGEVRAVYHYERVGDFLLPTRAQIVVSGFPLRAEVVYNNYRLNVPLPLDLLQGAGAEP